MKYTINGMKSRIAFIAVLSISAFAACRPAPKTAENKQADVTDTPTVYHTENLTLKKLSAKTYVHTSYLHTNDFGKVPCNGMLVVSNHEAIVFDTPADNKSALELINFASKNLKCKIVAVVPTHFHDDCVGGISTFQEHGISAYASEKTLTLLKKKGKTFAKPIQKFNDSLTLSLGKQKIYAKYFGEGHTNDNVVVYFPEDEVMFGGCLIKEVGAGKGNLEDANTNAWPETVKKVKNTYPKAKIIIPGHGKLGGTELLDYTIKLFSLP
jgi:metallo-beta-lactamase class B